MAQSFEEILTEINQAQAEQPELNSLTSTSSVSVWGLVKNMFALLSLTLQKSFDKFAVEIDALIVSQQIGTLPWYVEKLKAFQYGDTIFVEDNNVTYSAIDESKKIIAQASATEVLVGDKSELLLKAVKADTNGNLEPLSVNENDALQEYISKIKFAGVTINLVSAAADVIKLNMTVELNLLMVNANGSAIDNSDQYPVKIAIENYFKNLPFDGVLYWNKLIDVLQEMPEVKDAIISESWSYASSVYTPFTRLYKSYSGHLLLDENSVITYV
jgi:hypothetical protein